MPAASHSGVPSPNETFALLQGTWYFSVGGSNAWATSMALANQLEPYHERYSPEKGRKTPRWADTVWELQPDSGAYALQYYRWLNATGIATHGGNGGAHAAFDDLPSWSASRVRLTFAHCFFWPKSGARGSNHRPRHPPARGPPPASPARPA